MNAGYIITDSVHVGEVEFVLGVHSTAPKQFVTWTCKDGKDYYWGHYHSDLLSATKGRVNATPAFCVYGVFSRRAEPPTLHTFAMTVTIAGGIPN